MGKLIDLKGKTFSKFIVLQHVGKNSYGHSLWKCKCICGNIKIISGRDLIYKNTKSCGCFLKTFISKANTKHGLSKHRIYRVWCAMKNRCKNQNTEHYKDYGGRGIRVCKRWENFENFIKDMGIPPKGFTLNRINNNGNYEPENCQWTDRQSQANNRRSSKMITFNGKTHTIAQWSTITKIPQKTIQKRFSRGYPVNKIFLTTTIQKPLKLLS